MPKGTVYTKKHPKTDDSYQVFMQKSSQNTILQKCSKYVIQRKQQKHQQLCNLVTLQPLKAINVQNTDLTSTVLLQNTRVVRLI